MFDVAKPFTLMIALLLCAVAGSSTGQELGVIGLFPPGAAPGESVEITCRGNAAVWPVEVWVDRDGITGASLEEKGKIKLELAADAAPGVYWVRLHSANHVSKPLPFYVDRIASVLEEEPNNRISEATTVEVGSALMGRLEKTGEVDTFHLTLDENERITVAVMAHRPIGSPMDAVIQICDAQGLVLDQNDDSRGVDPQLTFVAPDSGSYYLRLFAFPETPTSSVRFAGGETFVYRVEVCSGDRFEHPIQDSSSSVIVVEDSDTESVLYFREKQLGFIVAPTPTVLLGREQMMPSIESPLGVPDSRWGLIAERDEMDRFQLELEKDQNIRVVAESRPFLMELDPMLIIRKADGSKAIENDDFNKQRKAQVDFKAPEAGVYQVEISDASRRGGSRFGYRLRVQSIEPSYQLFTTAGLVQLPPGQTVELVVNVLRMNGFDQPIRVEATGLAEGVECEPVESLMGTDTEKKVTLKLTAAEGFTGHPIRIAGQAADRSPQLAHFLIGVGASKHAALWCLSKSSE